MICKVVLEVTVEDDFSFSTLVMGMPNLSTDFKNLYFKMLGISKSDEIGNAVLKDLIALGDSFPKEVTS